MEAVASDGPLGIVPGSVPQLGWSGVGSAASGSYEGFPKCPPYTITNALGQGSFGIAYLAYHESNKAVPLVLKFPHDSDRVAALRREAITMQELSHPNVVSFREFVEAGDQSFIVMDYVSGGNLAELLRRRLLTSSETARIFVDILRALDYIHLKGIFHRDIKCVSKSSVLAVLLLPANECCFFTRSLSDPRTSS